MKMPSRRVTIAALMAVALSSCQPPPRDIIVVRRDGHLVVDFPWSLWRLIGLQDRTYCIRGVELFDRDKLLWTLKAEEDVQCIDVTMPLRVGAARAGFTSEGRPILRQGIAYGIAISGIGDGRVDFTLSRTNRPKNETDWEKQIRPPCGSDFGECPRVRAVSMNAMVTTDGRRTRS